MTTRQTPTIQISRNEVIDHIIGMTEEQAIRTLKLNGIDEIRIMKEDCPYTAEHRFDRVNIIIKNNLVIEATRG